MMWDVLLWSKYFQLYSKCLECCCLPGCHCWCSLRCRFQTPIEELLDRGFGWNLHEDDGFPLLLQHRKQWANELVMTYQQEAEAGHPAGVGMCVCSWCSPWGHLDQQG